MLAADKHVAILNDLIRINNDRIAGYRIALEKLSKNEKVIYELFEKLRDESIAFREGLINKVAVLGGEVATDTTFSGKVYRTWMDLKATIGGTDTTAILGSCVFGESAWQKAYEAILSMDSGLPEDSLQLIQGQYEDGCRSAALLEACQQMLSPP